MTNEQIMALPTVNDLAKWQREQIAAKQADGTYNYNTLQSIIAERDAMVVRVLVSYHDQDGNENYEWVWGNAKKISEKKAAFIRYQEQMNAAP